MKPLPWQVNELKSVLENIQTPGRLDHHPWTKCLILQDEIAKDPALGQKSAGYQLLTALSRLFREMMPSTPPRSGKRLDTRWCQFGMLAAQYFAPFLYGSIYPSSLRDVWGRIDQVIPLFVFGKNVEAVDKKEVEQYRLLDNEEEPAPYSTLSDWHVRGLQNLAELFLNREHYLQHTLSLSSPALDAVQQDREGGQEPVPASPRLRPEKKKAAFFSRRTRRVIGLSVLLLFLILVAGLGVKTWRLYQKVQTVRNDITNLEKLAGGQLDLDTLQQAGAQFPQAHQDVEALYTEAKPVLWMGHFLGWVPVYGGDLAMSASVLEMARDFTAAADEVYEGAQPLEAIYLSQNSGSKFSALATALQDGQSRFVDARTYLEEAESARTNIDVQHLSPSLSKLVVKIDPYLEKLDDSLTILLAAPKLLGASESGPQTYLVLLQNEDELRATGGFITGVGAVVIKAGEIVSFRFENSYDVDDWNIPYPGAPQFLRNYMNIQAITLRDSNWLPDFPTSAALAEYLYAYTRSYNVNGVIALDQHFMVSLLKVLGPVDVADAPYPITAENVIGYMRSQRRVYEENEQGVLVRKTFFEKIGEALFTKLQAGSDLPFEALGKVVTTGLEEHHLLIQIDDQSVASLLGKLGWDGAVRPGANDYLFVVDSNVGYTKGNPLIDETLSYTIDLSDLQSPAAILTVAQKNNAAENVPCLELGLPSDKTAGEDLYNDLMNRCYWDYLRVYKPTGTVLSGATPHAIPGKWMILGEDVPARVDLLDEGMDGVQGFGTLVVVPGGTTLETGFSFALPAQVIAVTGTNSRLYRLRVQKQPGTLAIPITLRIQLPENAVVVNSSPAGTLLSGEWQLDATLKTDLEIQIEFKIP